jgi:uncharacterized ferritin-like protein (DUF455 family)
VTATLAQMAVEVLTTADGRAKTALGRRHAAAWRDARAAGSPLPLGQAQPPARPARPDAPELLAPRDVPRRRPGTLAGRIALLHAVAHIELNAVDLHWDIIARFTDTRMPMGFYDDWVKAADEEAKHFNLICDCLEAQALDALSVIYGEEVAHVAYGSKWFHFLCGRQDIDPKEVFHDLVRRYFHGALKPPFNEEKRAEAGIPPDFYWPLSEQTAQRTGD